MMAKAVSDIVRAIAPLEEEEVRAFMLAEAAKYHPNFWWKVVDWASRNALLVFIGFAIFVASELYRSGKPLGLDAVMDVLPPTLIIFVAPLWFATMLKKGPAQWYASSPRSVRLYLDDERMLQLFKQHPEAMCEVETLHRAAHRRSFSLGVVVWLVLPEPDGTALRRGVSSWAMSSP